MNAALPDDEQRQPTMEELRAKMGAQSLAGGGKPKYAGVAGSGPAGKMCRDCGWFLYSHHSEPKHPKCGKTAWTSGDATTIKARTPACEHFATENQKAKWNRDKSR